MELGTLGPTLESLGYSGFMGDSELVDNFRLVGNFGLVGNFRLVGNFNLVGNFGLATLLSGNSKLESFLVSSFNKT